MFIYKKIRRIIIQKADDESILERLMSFIEEHYGLFAAAVFSALSNAGASITTSAVAEVMNTYRSAAERYRTDDAPEKRPSTPNSGAPPDAAEGPIPIEHILEDTATGNVIDELVKAFEDDDIQKAYESALSHGITSVSNDLKLPSTKKIQSLLPAPSFHYNEFYERWCSEHCGKLIIEISDSQRENVRQIINNALQNGHSVDKAAKEIRRTVGLTERQTWANIRYSDRMYEELKKVHPHMSSTTLRKLADEAADKYAQTQRRKRSIDIARTELAKAQMQASLEYIKWAQELGLIQDIYGEWVTSGKSNVCPVCRELNHKAVDLKKDPLPPLHPRCACGIRFVSGSAESEIAELRGIKPSDYAQYIRYRDRLGENNVGSIDIFIDLNYNKPEEFKLLMDYFDSRGTNMISAFTTFDDYKLYKDRISKELIGLTTIDGIKIQSQSKHFIERVFGTNEDPHTGRPRNGVEIEDIKDALLHGTVIQKKNSVKYRTEKCEVSVNPLNGNLIQTNPQ